jgi:hypothetical protein
MPESHLFTFNPLQGLQLAVKNKIKNRINRWKT